MTLQTLLDRNNVLLLDGPMGTELERRGYYTQLPLWSAMANEEAADLVCAIHKDYLHAGADILTANTFRTTGYTLAKQGRAELAQSLSQRAVQLARQAMAETGAEAVVAASLAPLEDCYTPSLLPDRTTMTDALDAQIGILTGCGADCILAETMINLPEAEYIAQKLAEAHMPFMMSFTSDHKISLLDGTPLRIAVGKIARYGPQALLVNCRPPSSMDAALDILLEEFNGPVGVYANGPGAPDPDIGWRQTAGAAEAYVAYGQRWLDKGVRIIGGCCGTTPDTISALRHLISAAENRSFHD